MKLDLHSQRLFTDAGAFLIKLACPKRADWHAMQPSGTAPARACTDCNRRVYDTALMSDADLVILLEKEPGACLAISLSQSNCTILPHR